MRVERVAVSLLLWRAYWVPDIGAFWEGAGPSALVSGFPGLGVGAVYGGLAAGQALSRPPTPASGTFLTLRAGPR